MLCSYHVQVSFSNNLIFRCLMFSNDVNIFSPWVTASLQCIKAAFKVAGKFVLVQLNLINNNVKL
jgi:hypothetical protein